MLVKIVLLLFSFLLQNNQVEGACTNGYPQSWSNVRWLFTRYQNEQDSYLEFTGNSIQKKEWSQQLIQQRVCQDEYQDGDWYYYSELSTEFYYCVAYYTKNDIMQEMIYGTGRVAVSSASACRNYVGPSGTAIEVTIYYREVWPTPSCSPLPQGDFYTSFSFNDGNQNICAGDISRYSTILADRISVKTCYTGVVNTYNPYNQTLSCLMYWPNVLGKGSGDYMALVFTDGSFDYLFCARFTVTGNHIDMSVDVRAASSTAGGPIKCIANKNPDYYEDSQYFKHRSFDFNKVNHCDPSPCQHGSTCRLTDNGQAAACDCVLGFAGPYCQTNIDECASQPCFNGATCDDQANKYACQCPLGYIGDNCETNVEDCQEGACANGGICIDEISGFHCNCKPGYSGDTCGQNIDECASNPCDNGGLCFDEVNGYNCTCGPGYAGQHCEQNINECWSNPCTHGSCADLINRYTCSCDPGYEGIQCDQETNECSSNPCKNGAECQDLVNGYKCLCPAGFVGDLCETEIDECYSNPCFNNATCQDEVDGYRCLCNDNSEGLYCEVLLLEKTFIPKCKFGYFVCDEQDKNHDGWYYPDETPDPSKWRCVNYQRTCNCVQDCQDNTDEASCPVEKRCLDEGRDYDPPPSGADRSRHLSCLLLTILCGVVAIVVRL